MDKNKILILVPYDHRPGGVANYYRVLKRYLSPHLKYFTRGEGRPGEKGMQKYFRLLKDFTCYRKRVRSGRYKGVVLNTSLDSGGFFRDFVFMMLTPGKMKTIFFIRGWNLIFEKQMNSFYFKKRILKYLLRKANFIIVLSKEFKVKIIGWGFEGSICVETTLVDEELVRYKTWKVLCKERLKRQHTHLLYLGNIKKEKGVEEAVMSLKYLSKKLVNRQYFLTVAGKGEMLEKLQVLSSEEKLPIDFPGYVSGSKKAETFEMADIYLFPSNHGEGMPNSVLEAMAFGLPVITTRVGGIPDFFEEGKMGLFLDSREPKHIAEKIEYLMERPELMKEISEYNYNYAKEHFYASNVAARLEKIIDDVVEGKA